MDLRPYVKDRSVTDAAAGVLNYQPFILSDYVQTGVAYSWLYENEGGRSVTNAGDFVMRRDQVDALQWQRFCDANAQLRNMYEDWLDVLASTYPGGSLLDPACNNGYFLAGAMRRGMKKATGYDREDYSNSLACLNYLLGTEAKFYHRAYSPWVHTIEGCEPHDVAVASLIMCHISDPLYFMNFLSTMAREAIFLFTGMSTEPDYKIHYSKARKFYKFDEFPVCFDNNVGLSEELLFDSLSHMGFKNIKILEHKESWLPAEWYNAGNQKAILAMRS